MQDSHIAMQDTNGTKSPYFVHRGTDPYMLQPVKVAHEPWYCFVLAAQQTIQIEMITTATYMYVTFQETPYNGRPVLINTIKTGSVDCARLHFPPRATAQLESQHH